MKIKDIIFKFKKDYILAITFMILSAFCGIYSAKYFGLLVQEGLVKKDTDIASYFGFLVLILIACSIIFQWRAKRKMIEASGKSIELLRSNLFEFIQKIKISFYDTTPLGKIVTRITHDVDSMEGFLSGSFAQYCVEGVSFILSVIAMIILSPKYGIVLVLGFIPVFILIFISHRKIGGLFKNEASYRSQANANLAEFTRGYLIVRIFGLESWAFKKYSQVLDKLKESRLMANLFYTWFFPLASLFSYLPTVMHLGAGAYFVAKGELALYLFIAFFQYTSRISSSLNIFVHELQQVYNIITCANRVKDFLKSPLEFENLKIGTINNHPVVGGIKYQNVSMQYNDSTWALKDINFEITPGEKIGLIGRTGSGKTTCINLLSRLYEFQEGQILIDGVDIRELDPYYLRDSIGVVSQEVVLFKGTILENITLGNHYPMDVIEKAVQIVGLDKILKRNKMNLDTYLYDHGSNLSTGERQLVSIARIYLRSPKILIMDEATSNIDENYEKIIHSALYKLMHGKTCLFIAHRLETLNECNRIFEFKGGELTSINTQIS